MKRIYDHEFVDFLVGCRKVRYEQIDLNCRKEKVIQFDRNEWWDSNSVSFCKIQIDCFIPSHSRFAVLWIFRFG